MAAQARVQLSERQAEQLIACRRSMLRRMGALIAEWDRLWTALQVRPVAFMQRISRKHHLGA